MCSATMSSVWKLLVRQIGAPAASRTTCSTKASAVNASQFVTASVLLIAPPPTTLEWPLRPLHLPHAPNHSRRSAPPATHAPTPQSRPRGAAPGQRRARTSRESARHRSPPHAPRAPPKCLARERRVLLC